VCVRERDLGQGELHEREKRREGESELIVSQKISVTFFTLMHLKRHSKHSEARHKTLQHYATLYETLQLSATLDNILQHSSH